METISKKKIYIYLIAVFFFSSCATAKKPVPVGTIPQAKKPTVADEQYGHKAFGQITKQHKLTYDHPRYNELQEVVKRLTSSINADKDPWHIYLLDADNVKNAGATRGNHIFVWTGMLNYTKDENELAAIMAHEISHILARHTDPDQYETMKKALIGIGSMAIGVATANVTGIGQIGQIATQLGSKVGEGLFLNPYSQGKEHEADQVGLFLMAKAKFNPQAAIDFWQRASNDSSFSSGAAFFSTHPSSGDRMQRLSSMLAQANAVYLGHNTVNTTPYGTQSAPLETVHSNTSSTQAINPPISPEITSQEQSPQESTPENSIDTWDVGK